MGEARRRGTYEERKALAIKNMKAKPFKFINLDAKPKGLVVMGELTRWLVHCAAVNAYNGLQDLDHDNKISNKDL